MHLDVDSLKDLRRKVRGTNINEHTLLATDYLNHLNEPVMLLEMVADAPELLEDLAAWRPKSYVEHFAASSFADRDLAIRAYAVAPKAFRVPFDRTVECAARCVVSTVQSLIRLSAEGRGEELRTVATEVTATLGALIDRASSLIHGELTTLGQAQIDRIMNG